MKVQEIHYTVDAITLYHLFVSTTTEFIQHAHQSPSIITAHTVRDRERGTENNTDQTQAERAQSDLRLVDTDKPCNPTNANDITEQSLMHFEN